MRVRSAAVVAAVVSLVVVDVLVPTPVMVSASGGEVVGSREFDPLGVLIASAGVDVPVGFQGDLTEGASGLVWMGARWFDPALGRFASRDSFAGRIGLPLSANRFAYGDGDPLGRWDPTGFSAEPVKLTLTNEPTTTWVESGPVSPRTGWSWSAALRGVWEGLSAPIVTVARVFAEPIVCVADKMTGESGHGCADTARAAADAVVHPVDTLDAMVSDCSMDVSRCVGSVLGGLVFSAGAGATVAKLSRSVSRLPDGSIGRLSPVGGSGQRSVLRPGHSSPMDTDDLGGIRGARLDQLDPRSVAPPDGGPQPLNSAHPNPTATNTADDFANWGGEFVDDAIRAPVTRPDFANMSTKIQRQMQTRGWTPELVDEAVLSGTNHPAVNKLGGANTPATRYVSPTTGQSVVIDNATGEIIQVGGPGFKYGVP